MEARRLRESFRQDPVHLPPPLKEQQPANPRVEWLIERDRVSEAREALLRHPLPKDPLWRARLALTYLETGDYASALEHYPYCEPNAQVLFEWGRCHHHLRQWDRALELLHAGSPRSRENGWRRPRSVS